MACKVTDRIETQVTKVVYHVYVFFLPCFCFMLLYVDVLVLTHAIAQNTFSYMCTLSAQIFSWEASPINQNMLLHCLHGFFERYHLQTWRISQKTQQMCGVFIGPSSFWVYPAAAEKPHGIPWKSKTMKIPLKKIIVPGDLFFVIGIFHQKFE